MSPGEIDQLISEWETNPELVPEAISERIRILAMCLIRIERKKSDAGIPNVFDERMRVLAAEGKTIKEIALALGRSYSSVFIRSKVLGLSVFSHSSRIDRQVLLKCSELWRNGSTVYDIERACGHNGASLVAKARKVLGIDMVPMRNPRKKQKREERKRPGLICASEINRHLVRRVSDTEYVVRDDAFREELWRVDPHGIVFKNNRRLTFVGVLGMTERRVPDDLRRIYPS